MSDEEEGDIIMPSVIPKMSGTPGRIAHAGPVIGSYNDEIYRELLGKSEEELATLKKDGVI